MEQCADRRIGAGVADVETPPQTPKKAKTAGAARAKKTPKKQNKVQEDEDECDNSGGVDGMGIGTFKQEYDFNDEDLVG